MNEVLGHNEQEFLTSTSEQNGGRHDTGHISNRTYLAKAPGHYKQERARGPSVCLEMVPCDLAKGDKLRISLFGRVYCDIATSPIWVGWTKIPRLYSTEVLKL